MPRYSAKVSREVFESITVEFDYDPTVNSQDPEVIAFDEASNRDASEWTIDRTEYSDVELIGKITFDDFVRSRRFVDNLALALPNGDWSARPGYVYLGAYGIQLVAMGENMIFTTLASNADTCGSIEHCQHWLWVNHVEGEENDVARALLEGR